MCTASWAPAPDGYTFCFNRDERRTRAPALPPAEREAGGTRYLAPLDGDFGGTWIAVNSHGLSFGLLNRYTDHPATEPEQPLSRGLLIPAMVECVDLMMVAYRLERINGGRFRPFTLLALAPGHAALVGAWDGTTMRLQRASAPGLLLTSSAVDEPEVAAMRRRTFDSLDDITGATLETLHRSHVPERSGRSICMHRPDAETQSYTRIVVTPQQATMHHTPGAPCERAAPLTLQLARTPAALSIR